MPVWPEVESMIALSYVRAPVRSPSSIIQRAARSFTEPPGLNHAAFPNTSTRGNSRSNMRMRSSGVLPIKRVIPAEAVRWLMFKRIGTRPASGIPEDRVRSASTPDDVRLARPDSGTVLESCAPVHGPGHLKDAFCSLNPFDPQTLAKAAPYQVCDERDDGVSELLSLACGELFEVSLEPFGCRPGGHPCRLLRESAQEVLLGLIGSRVSLADVVGCLVLGFLPGGRPEPGLGRIDQLSWSQQDAIRRNHHLDGVSLS